jgi:hypothetical protein
MKKIITTLLTIVISSPMMPVSAEEVFVPSYKGTTATTDVMPCPPSCPAAGFTLFGASNFSASQATPAPVIPNNARRIIYGNAEGAAWSVTPTDVVVTPNLPAGTGPYTFTALQNIGVYKVYLTKGQTNNASTNIVVSLTAVGGDLADANGVAATEVLLDIYQRSNTDALHKWFHVGYLTNHTASPTLTLTHVSGAINDADAAANNAQRWYVDAFRFEYLDQCAGVAEQVSIGGPLIQGQTSVNVIGVASGATNVTVYAQGIPVGQATHPTGFAGGTVAVSTSTLNKGEVITAGQTKDGCFSIVPGSGPVVGGGPNATLKAFLAFWKHAEFAGPTGANAPSDMLTNTTYFLKATGFTSGFGTAPLGGEILAPGTCWQTVTFDHAIDPTLAANGSYTTPNADPFAALEGLMFAIQDADSGPYDVYIDQILNGDVIIEDFEGYIPGTANTFTAPNQAASPNPASTYLSAPNSSLIAQNNVFEGTNSLRIQWQWTEASDIRWAHILANNTNSGKVYPQIDVSKPITIRYLVLPVGETTNRLFFQSVPASQTKSIGQSVTFSVQPVGDGPFTYEWQHEGNPIEGATGSSYTRSNLQLGDAGNYSVIVTGSTGCTATHKAKLTVLEVVPQPTLNFSVSAGQITLTWEGNFTLERATAITGPWTDVSVTSGYQESLSSSATRFFRLRQ